MLQKLKSFLDFKKMTFMYKFRDFLIPPINVLKKVGIQSGFYVLDYGCGSGSYLVPLAELVGKSGKIYALDVNPIAILRVQNIASKNNWKIMRRFYQIVGPGYLIAVHYLDAPDEVR